MEKKIYLFFDFKNEILDLFMHFLEINKYKL